MQQHSDPKHTDKTTKGLFGAKQWKVLDLNPTENVSVRLV